MVVLFFVLALTGCAVATGTPTWVPVTGLAQRWSVELTTNQRSACER